MNGEISRAGSNWTTGVFPAPPKDLSPHEAFQRFGADEWDNLRERYREPKQPAPVKAPWRWVRAQVCTFPLFSAHSMK